MEKTELKFLWRNDEIVDILIDGDLVMVASYDDFGWSGLHKVMDGFQSVAEKMGWELISVSFDYEDE